MDVCEPWNQQQHASLCACGLQLVGSGRCWFYNPELHPWKLRAKKVALSFWIPFYAAGQVAGCPDHSLWLPFCLYHLVQQPPWVSPHTVRSHCCAAGWKVGFESPSFVSVHDNKDSATPDEAGLCSALARQQKAGPTDRTRPHGPVEGVHANEADCLHCCLMV